MGQFPERRTTMVERDLIPRGIRDPRVIAAMKKIPRHLFVPPALSDEAYADGALPIDQGQTISQPYVVALMAEALGLKPTDRLLEIGTGSAYAAAIAAELCAEVFTIERHPSLAALAVTRLAELGCRNVHVRCGDGTFGWPETAPFEAISVTAAGARIPDPLLRQLATGGRLVMPVGTERQTLVRICDGRREELIDVRFVPLIGEG